MPMKKPTLKIMQSIASVITIFSIIFAYNYVKSPQMDKNAKAKDALINTLIVIGAMTMIPVVTILPMWIAGRK